jgi:hypothetical protein
MNAVTKIRAAQDEPKTKCSVIFLRNSDGAPFIHHFEISEREIQQGRIYDYILACWGSVADYQNLKPALCRREEPTGDGFLVTYPSLCQYVERKLLEEETSRTHRA